MKKLLITGIFALAAMFSVTSVNIELAQAEYKSFGGQQPPPTTRLDFGGQQPPPLASDFGGQQPPPFGGQQPPPIASFGGQIPPSEELRALWEECMLAGFDCAECEEIIFGRE